MQSRSSRGRLVVGAILVATLALLHSSRPAAAQQPAPGSVLFYETFDNPAAGQMPRRSAEPDVRVGYVDGEYQVAIVTAGIGWVAIPLPDGYADATLAVDARLMGAADDRYVQVLCRADGARDQWSGYALRVAPAAGQFFLLRLDNSIPTPLASGHVPAVRPAAESNRLRLGCDGTTITADVNDTRLATVQDAAYRAGRMAIGVGTFTPGAVDARFDNLVVTAGPPPAPAGAAPTAPTAPAPPPTPPTPGAETVLLVDSFDDPAMGVLPGQSPRPEAVRYGYVNGEYQIQKVATAVGLPFVLLPGTYTDTTFTIDARLVGETAGRIIGVFCRQSGTPLAGYGLLILPAEQLYLLLVEQDSDVTPLATGRSPMIRPGTETNRLQLTCDGTTVAATVNGARLATATDTTHRAGRLAIGVGTVESGQAEARFDNLRVTAGAPPGPLPAMTGDVLLTDTFDDPAMGVLPRQSNNPAVARLAYVDGEYQVEKVDRASGLVTVSLPGTYADATLTVEVHLVGEPDGRVVALLCRQSGRGDQTTGYALLVSPTNRQFALVREDMDDLTLLESGFSAAIRPGTERNRLQLACSGTTIAAAVNDQALARVTDGTYPQGRMALGIGADEGQTAVARFDNLRVTAGLPRGPAVPAAPAPPPAVGAEPGTVLLADDFEAPEAGALPSAASTAGQEQGYADGEYVLRVLARAATRFVTVPLETRDAAIGVDARLVGEPADQRIAVGCRYRGGPAGVSGYLLFVEPRRGMFWLYRYDAARPTLLAGPAASAAIQPGNARNRLELRCVGATITAVINGTEVATVADRTYTQGQFALGLASGTAAEAEARFDNLVVTAR
jgi:hypothetical protein